MKTGIVALAAYSSQAALAANGLRLQAVPDQRHEPRSMQKSRPAGGGMGFGLFIRAPLLNLMSLIDSADGPSFVFGRQECHRPRQGRSRCDPEMPMRSYKPCQTKVTKRRNGVAQIG